MTGQEKSTSFNNNYESDFASFVLQKRRRQDQFWKLEANKESNKPINEYEYEGDISPEDNMDLDDNSVEQFATPENDSEFVYPDTNALVEIKKIGHMENQLKIRPKLTDITNRHI
ncbi:hypothetical protein RhiirC2_801991 [Rhizophagus irregularis]|uniref:Uncharacterized protein n=1 Tax=Rhizophagus irregularis TaxID=588596 RepID=A0A2N1M1T4_9GLOM|nr:hypothetical protein RhiirC2_801991 [Rhizophagus irregularis]